MKPCQRAGLVTAAVAAVSSFGVQLAAMLGDVMEWAAGTGDAPDFDAARALLVSVVFAVAAGVLNWVYRCAQERYAWLPGQRLQGYVPRKMWAAPNPEDRVA